MITQKIKQLITSFAALAVLVAPVAVSATPAFAAADIKGGVCTGTDINISTTGNNASCTGDTGNSGLNTLLTNVVNIFSAIVGVIAVLMVIWGGLRYITSGGDQNKVASAKNTLIYAVIGLIIVALSQVIVHFVLQQANKIA